MKMYDVTPFLLIIGIILIFFGFKKAKLPKKKVLLIIIGIIGTIVVILIMHCCCSSSDYPKSGSETTTMEKPVTAYIDPMKAHTKGFGGKLRFVLASDNSISFVSTGINKHDKQWWAMPAGNYLVYPYGADRVLFEWDNLGSKKQP
jgi:amino acid transporter